MLKKLYFVLFLVVLTAVSAFGQRILPTPTPMPSPSPTPFQLETVLTEAEKQTEIYRENFNNLLADETKTFEDYKRDGKLKNSRAIESNFLVYQSSKNSDSVVEYRNVVKVDGKVVADNNKRAQDFFETALKSVTAEQELRKIQEESSRYDKNLDISGLTLNQAPVLAEHIRPFFEFQLLGRENINGNELFIIAYRQKSKSPYVIFNNDKAEPKELFIDFEVDLPGSVKEANALLKGKLWIDTKTFQLLREERELTIQPDESKTPFTVIKTDFEYGKSDLEISVPKKITLVDYAVKRKDKEITAVPETKAVFVYSKFTKSDVEVKSGDVKN